MKLFVAECTERAAAELTGVNRYTSTDLSCVSVCSSQASFRAIVSFPVNETFDERVSGSVWVLVCCYLKRIGGRLLRAA